MIAWHGNQPGSGIESGERRMMATHVTEILGEDSLPANTPGDLFRLFTGEADAICEALRVMSVGEEGIQDAPADRQWKKRTLAVPPTNLWVTDEQGRQRVVEDRTGSLGFLLRAGQGVPPEGRKALATRRQLCERLWRTLPEPLHTSYAAMLKWVADVDPEQPLADDSAMGVALYWLDGLYGCMLNRLEWKWRTQTGYPQSDPTPADIMVDLAANAKSFVERRLNEVAQAGAALGLQDSLAVRLTANLSANRAMQELAKVAWFESEACALCVRLLNLLIAADVTAIPTDLDGDLTPEQQSKALARWLNTLLGDKGRLTRAGGGTLRAMTSNIEAAVAMSQSLHEAFLAKERIALRELADVQYGSGQHRFMFLLALTGAFVFKTKVSWEFSGGKQKNTKHALFPGFTDTDCCITTLTAHGVAIIERCVALMFRTVDAQWTFNPDAVQERSSAKLARLACQQDLHAVAVKGRTASELRGVFNFLEELRQSPADQWVIELETPGRAT
jgi:hypothetical protein